MGNERKELEEKILTVWIVFAIIIVIFCGAMVRVNMIDLTEECAKVNGTEVCFTCQDTKGLEGLGRGLTKEEEQKCGCHCYLNGEEVYVGDLG